jgi:uncharacterized membrane protein YqjE
MALVDSARRLVANLLALAQMRLELAATELQLEVQRAGRVLLWAFVAILCGALTVLMLAITILIVAWDEHRILAAAILTLVFCGLAAIATWMARRQTRTHPRLLSATLEELERDRAAWNGPPST